MGPDSRLPSPRLGGLPGVVAAALCLVLGAGAQAQANRPIVSKPAPAAQIFQCVDAAGKKITSDRPIVDCSSSGRDQRELNPDGSFKRSVPPPPTADEAADADSRARMAAAALAARNDAIRRDRNLVNRFPDEAAHAKARAKALDDIGNSVRISEARINLLNAERKPLMDEAEFYVGKIMPSKLKNALDSNDASLEGQKALVQNQQTEVVRINTRYDEELTRLRKLWAGAPAGSLGPLSPGTPASAAKSTALNSPPAK
ncbi:MAG: DUF4124 domain-containing protein [Caldimonas sp.]